MDGLKCYDLLTAEALERLLRDAERDYEEVGERVDAMREALEARQGAEA